MQQPNPGKKSINDESGFQLTFWQYFDPARSQCLICDDLVAYNDRYEMWFHVVPFGHNHSPLV